MRLSGHSVSLVAAAPAAAGPGKPPPKEPDMNARLDDPTITSDPIL
jgi:hypothetical protein